MLALGDRDQPSQLARLGGRRALGRCHAGDALENRHQLERIERLVDERVRTGRYRHHASILGAADRDNR